MQSPAKKMAIGVDLGGTKVEVALVDSNGNILSTNRYPTRPEKGSEGIITDTIDAVNKFNEKTGEKAQTLGVGVAGQVTLTGVVRSAPNLPFQNEPLQDRLEKELGLPGLVTNDVRAATYGEWRYGAGKGVDDLVVIFIGTGIGGGVISGSRLLQGCNNTSGELGHITIIADGRRCRCLNYGCLEAYAGGWAMAERAQKAVYGDLKEGDGLKSIAGTVEGITAATVGQAYHEGDPLAERLVEETGRYLAAGVVGVVNAFNPCILVLGGGVIEGIPELVSMVESLTRERALKSNLETLRIVKAALGGNSGVVGAAALALDKVGKVP